MSRVKFAVLVVAALAACRPGMPTPPRHTAMDLTISNATLANGLRVVLVRDPRATDIQVTMRYGVGAADDPPGQAGIAHLVEHLMFEQVLGTESIFAKLETHAREYNAFTSYDATTYITRAPADQLETLLSIEAVRFGFRCTSITPSVFEREREVVVNESRLRDRSLEQLTAIHRGVFTDAHPYARNPSPESVGAITMAQACAFADAHYAPTNAVLVISGDVNDDRVVTAMNKFIARMPRREAAPSVAIGAAPRRRIDATAPLSGDAVLVAWPVPSDPVRRALARAVWDTVVSSIDARVKGVVLPVPLGDSRAEMLGALIYRKDDETAAEVIANAKQGIAGAPLAFSIGGRFGQLVFNVIQQQALFETFSGFEDGSDRDTRIASHVLAGREPKTVLSDALRSLGALTPVGAAALTRELFSVDRATVVSFTAEEKTRGSARRELAAPIRDRGLRRDTPDPAEAHQPDPTQLAADRGASVIARTLPNGMRIVLLPLTSVPTVDARIVFGAGAADEPTAKRGAAMLAGYALQWRRRDVDDWLALVESGGTTDVEVGLDHVAFSTRGLDMHLDYLLASLRRIVRDGGYTSNAKALVRALRRGAKHADDETKLDDRYRAARYGLNHPYVAAGALRYVSPSLTVADARAFRAAYFTPDNATLVISGRFDAALANRWIDHLFADWKGTAARRADARAVVQPSAIAKDDDLGEAQIAITLPAVGGARAERMVAAAMLDEITDDVRHQLGAAYAFDAEYSEQRLATSYEISGATDAARTHEAISLLRDRLAKLHADPELAARAFVAARRRVLASLAASTGGAASIAARVTDDLRVGRGILSDARLAQEVKILTIERMPAALADLDLERAVIFMRGPAADVDRAFAVLGRTAQHIAAAAPADSESPFADAPTDDTDDLTDDGGDDESPTRFTGALLPGYAFGNVNNEGVTGPVLSMHVGAQVDQRITVGFLATVGKLTGANNTSVTPFVGALSVQANVGRVWGGGLLGLRLDDAAHPAILGSRWYKTIELGAELGAVLVKSGPHQLSAFARYERGLGSEIGLNPLTLGIGYRLY